MVMTTPDRQSRREDKGWESSGAKRADGLLALGGGKRVSVKGEVGVSLDLLYAFSLSAHPLPLDKTNHPVPIGRVLGFCALLETLCVLLETFRILLLVSNILLFQLRLVFFPLSFLFLAYIPLGRSLVLLTLGLPLLMLGSEIVTKHNGGREQPSRQGQDDQCSFLHVRFHISTSCKYLVQATCQKKQIK